MSALPALHWTDESYLTFERTSDRKHEYWNGEIYEMAGASINHNLIQANLIRILGNQLLDRENCFVYPSDMRVRVTPTGLYTYPDVSVVCGKALFLDGEADTLLNPTVIIEILSDSTSGYDRGKKFESYRTLDSLLDYILVEQTHMRIQGYSRQNDGRWLFNEVNKPDELLNIASIGCQLSPAEVYKKVPLSDYLR